MGRALILLGLLLTAFQLWRDLTGLFNYLVYAGLVAAGCAIDRRTGELLAGLPIFLVWLLFCG